MGESAATHEASGSVAARRPRWWRDLWWISAIVVLTAAVSLLWGLFGPEPAIRVSRETTLITEPLAGDGLPDYPAALLAMAGPAPPPEQNAAVLLLKTLGPLDLKPPQVSLVCGALGISTELPKSILTHPHHDAATGVSSDDFYAALARPWTGKDLPELEAWLVTNQRLIDQLVTASNLPRYWFPSADLWHDNGGLPISAASDPGRYRLISEILICRAMWHVGEGRHAEAWAELHAIYRIAVLVASSERKPLNVIEFLYAIWHREKSDTKIATALLAAPGLTRELLVRIRRDLAAIGPPPAAVDAVASDRIATLQSLTEMICRTPGGRAARVKEFKRCAFSKDRELFLWTRIDWNQVLELANDDYARIEAALRLPTFTDRRATLQGIQTGFRTDSAHWKQGSHRIMILLSLDYRSRYAAVRIRDGFMAERIGYLDIATRSHAEYELSRTAVALAQWKLDHEADGPPYPGRLDDLVPEYLPSMPNDPFSDAPLIYERRGDGYLLASVGQNGIYDGGVDLEGWIGGGEWHDTPQKVNRDKCDHVIRMPVPNRPFVRPESR